MSNYSKLEYQLEILQLKNNIEKFEKLKFNNEYLLKRLEYCEAMQKQLKQFDSEDNWDMQG
jgi:hypothetical protein